MDKDKRKLSLPSRQAQSKRDMALVKLTQRVTNMKKVMKDFVTYMDEPVVVKKRRIENTESTPSSARSLEERIVGLDKCIKTPELNTIEAPAEGNSIFEEHPKDGRRRKDQEFFRPRRQDSNDE